MKRLFIVALLFSSYSHSMLHTQRTPRSQMKRMGYGAIGSALACTAYKAFKHVEIVAGGNFPLWWQPVIPKGCTSNQGADIFLNHCMKVAGATILIGVISSISSLYCLRRALRS